MECVNGSKDTLEINIVVRWVGLGSVERVLGRIDVQDEVNASICQSVHASIVVGGVVNGVHTDGVETELLEVWDISLAAICICNRVCNIGRATRLIVDTSDVESVVAGEEC